MVSIVCVSVVDAAVGSLSPGDCARMQHVSGGLNTSINFIVVVYGARTFSLVTHCPR